MPLSKFIIGKLGNIWILMLNLAGEKWTNVVVDSCIAFYNMCQSVSSSKDNKYEK